VGAGLGYQARSDRPCSGARDQLAGVWDDERRQALQDAILGTGLSYAPDTWERVATPLDAYASAWVDAYTEACEATSVRREQSAAVMDLRMGCLRQHRVALREAVDVLAPAEPTRVTQAVTLVARLPALSRCDDVETLRAELPLPEDPEIAEQVVALREGLAQVRTLRHAGAYDQALTDAEAIVARADGLGHAPLRAEALLERGLARQRRAQYEEAARDLERAYLLAAELEHAEVEAAAVGALAIVVGNDRAEHDAGLLWAKTALALASRPRADPRERATVLSGIGMVLLGKGALEEALTHHQRALAIFEAALGPDHPDIADLLHNMGTVLLRQGKQDDALTHLRRARSIRERALGPRHPQVAHTLTAIGAVLIQRGEWEPALEHLRLALIIREEAFGPRHPDVATALNNIGAILKQQGQRKDALEHFARALDIQQEVLGARHPRVAYPLNNIGEVLRAEGKYDEALTYLERALAISEEALGPRHPDVASSAANLGNLLQQQKRYDEAEHQYRRALEIQREALPADHPDVASSLVGLARVGLAKNDLEQAREHAEHAVSIREKAKMAPELLAEARFVLARILWNIRGERARSRSLAEQAHTAWSNAGSDDPQTKEYLADVEQWLAEHRAR
jgi:eukaryotic-like serine/threonine-protein kinase